MTPKRRTSIVVTGDHLVAGHGDGRALGWVGRVAVRTHPALENARFYTLAAPSEDSAQFADRCIAEAELRYGDDDDKRLVLAPGCGDIAAGISTARSRLNLANILDQALSRGYSAFVVGPTPGRSQSENRQIEELNRGFSEVALRRSIPYVDCFTPLADHAVWQRELATSSEGLPGQEGYGLLSWLVLNRGWFEWLGVDDVTG
ncbi:lysophospholipase [Brevibacterium ravenspurgense]|uniref:Lysophospholipase n=1 Tax=Brevibacterium ravenspurgense TaxID=479117 RepID=A0A2I1IJA5_9MICO|nr:GDSL-type esterase/lipase family protein [Brevibacterium ravenspurgense]PKY71205.1 lysophospholipase [Brevibacterium ravenspurgense]